MLNAAAPHRPGRGDPSTIFPLASFLVAVGPGLARKKGAMVRIETMRRGQRLAAETLWHQEQMKAPRC